MADQPQTTNPPQANPPVTDDRAVASVAPSVVQSIASAPAPQPEPQTPARAKELGSTSAPETTPLIEVSPGAASLEQEPIPPEVEAWMEKVGPKGEQVKLENLPAVQVQAPTATPAGGSQPAFILPLGEEELKKGSQASVNDSIRWLTTWCQKIIKQLRGQVVYRGS